MAVRHRKIVGALICFFTTSLVIDGRRQLLTPTESRGMLEPKVAVQHTSPIFPVLNSKEKIAVWLRETKFLRQYVKKTSMIF